MNMVYDLDTLLPFPVAFDEYVSKAIGDDSQMDPKFHRYSKHNKRRNIF